MTEDQKREYLDKLTERSEILEAALVYLMTSYAVKACPAVAWAVVQHMKLLAEHPDIRMAPAKQNAYRQLTENWQTAAATGTSAAGPEQHSRVVEGTPSFVPPVKH